MRHISVTTANGDLNMVIVDSGGEVALMTYSRTDSTTSFQSFSNVQEFTDTMNHLASVASSP